MLRFLIVLAASLTCLSGGCSKGSKAPATFPVTGVVTYKGMPVDGAAVSLVPRDPKVRSATAMTNAEGKFEVATYYSATEQPKGAMPGEYAITVSKTSMPMLPEGLTPEQQMAIVTKAGPPKDLLPAKYLNPLTTPHKVTVKDASPEPLKIDLID